MEPTWPLAIFGGAVLTLFLSSFALWGWIGYRVLRGETLVPFEPRQPVPWNGPQVVCLLLAYVALQIAGSLLAGSLSGAPAPVIAPAPDLSHHTPADRLPLALLMAAEDATDAKEPVDSDKKVDKADEAIPDLVPQFIANILVNVLVVVLVIGILRLASGATWADLGLNTARLGHFLWLGLLGFVAAAAPVYLIQFILTLFVKESGHPIMVMLQHNREPAALIVAGLAAVVVAPVVEELLFRVLLQGWLESIWSTRPRANRSTDEPLMLPDEHALPGDRLLVAPIVISSAIFAALHAGHGPDPIPLFFLALLLGYLYQRTHRIWPSMALHFTLNSISLGAVLAMPPTA